MLLTIIWNFARKFPPHKETIKQRSKRLSKKIGVYFLLKKEEGEKKEC